MKKKTPVITNLRILKESRKPVHPGDIFVLQVFDDEYLFGRVVRTDATIVSMRDVILIYIYNVRSRSKTPIPALPPDKLLIPPKFINRLPWSRGYFETVAHVPLQKDDLLPVHCFLMPRPSERTPIKYLDEYDRELDRRYEPCGFQALGSFRTVDDDISKALGIPVAPD